jgi:hypothetical protein
MDWLMVYYPVCQITGGETMTGDAKTVVIFSFEKETKGAVRFQETDAAGHPISIADGAKIGTLYVRKSALNGTVPVKLKATLESIKE